VQSVNEIYTYYKKFEYRDRSDGRELPQYRPNPRAGRLRLPDDQSRTDEGTFESTEPLERKLDPEKAKSAKFDKLELDEKKFRWLLNENAMADGETGEGIRKFAADVVKLEKFVASKL
jgi:transaldolase